jgi:hypothetical protein
MPPSAWSLVKSTLVTLRKYVQLLTPTLTIAYNRQTSEFVVKAFSTEKYSQVWLRDTQLRTG